MALKLYTYWRSSAAFRVRIALDLKGLAFESVPRHLLRDGGEQRSRDDYLALNPQGLVPALDDDGRWSRSRSRSANTWRKSSRSHACCPVAQSRGRRSERWRSRWPATSIR